MPILSNASLKCNNLRYKSIAGFVSHNFKLAQVVIAELSLF
jgi:hypothetical protein